MKRRLDVINGLQLNIPVGRLQALSNQANIAYVSLDRPVQSRLDRMAGAMNVPVAWNLGCTGSGRRSGGDR